MIPVMGKAGQGNGYGGLPGSRKNNIIYIVIKYETPIKLIELYKVGSLLRFEKPESVHHKKGKTGYASGAGY